MLAVIATPFGALVELFVVVPLGLIVGIYGVEGAASLRRRRRP